MTRRVVKIVDRMIEVAQLGWGVTVRVLVMCLAVAAVAVALGFAGLRELM